MFKMIRNFFKRSFTKEKFPNRTKGKMDKTVGEVYKIKTTSSKEGGKQLLVLEPREEYRNVEAQ